MTEESVFENIDEAIESQKEINQLLNIINSLRLKVKYLERREELKIKELEKKRELENSYESILNFIIKYILIRKDDDIEISIENCKIMATEYKDINSEELHNIISKIDYNIYLKTNFWKLISMYKKNISGNKCNLCSSTKFLETHHNTYINYGKELNHLNDLIVLCKDCHNKFHKK